MAKTPKKIKPTVKPTPPPPETVKVHVLYSQSTTGGEATSDEPYSTREDEHTSTTFKGVVVGDEPDYSYHWRSQTFEVPKEAFNEPRAQVYAVVGYYSDGDTFHHSYGNIHIVDVYGNVDKAHAVAKSIEADERATRDSIMGSHRFPWGGYFARLERVEVEVLHVIGKSSNPADNRDPNDIPSW